MAPSSKLPATFAPWLSHWHRSPPVGVFSVNRESASAASSMTLPLDLEKKRKRGDNGSENNHDDDDNDEPPEELSSREGPAPAAPAALPRKKAKNKGRREFVDNVLAKSLNNWFSKSSVGPREYRRGLLEPEATDCTLEGTWVMDTILMHQDGSREEENEEKEDEDEDEDEDEHTKSQDEDKPETSSSVEVQLEKIAASTNAAATSTLAGRLRMELIALYDTDSSRGFSKSSFSARSNSGDAESLASFWSESEDGATYQDSERASSYYSTDSDSENDSVASSELDFGAVVNFGLNPRHLQASTNSSINDSGRDRDRSRSINSVDSLSNLNFGNLRSDSSGNRSSNRSSGSFSGPSGYTSSFHNNYCSFSSENESNESASSDRDSESNSGSEIPPLSLQGMPSMANLEDSYLTFGTMNDRQKTFLDPEPPSIDTVEFRQIVEDILHKLERSHLDWCSGALDTLQALAEEYVVREMQVLAMACQHRNGETIEPKDLELVRKWKEIMGSPQV